MRRIVSISLAILLIAAVAIAAFMLLGGLGTEEEKDLKEGDYLKYDWHSSMTNATMYINVTAVNETGYEVTTTLIHEDGYVETPDAFFVETGTELWWGENPDLDQLGTLIGTETLSTEFGSRNVNHYRNITETQTTDSWIGTDYMIMYKAVLEIGTLVMTIDLVETNIDWV